MSLFITLFAARVAIPQAAAWLEHNTAVYETMKESALKASGLDEKMEEMAQTAGLAGRAGERGHREPGDPGPDQKASDRE